MAVSSSVPGLLLLLKIIAVTSKPNIGQYMTLRDNNSFCYVYSLHPDRRSGCETWLTGRFTCGKVIIDGPGALLQQCICHNSSMLPLKVGVHHAVCPALLSVGIEVVVLLPAPSRFCVQASVIWLLHLTTNYAWFYFLTVFFF